MLPGRSCPLHYRYTPSDLVRAPEIAAATIYVAGGLYGNAPALAALHDLAAGEPDAVTLVFNGDFNWFNVDPDTFGALNAEVLRHVALRGNVETEIAQDDAAAGCGCGYPEWVGDDEVERSNRISERLRATARRFPALRAALGALPMFLAARVGGLRVAIVHGDLDSLAGWNYAQERLAAGANPEALEQDFAAAACRIIASSHTCLPVAADCDVGGKRCVLVNNGAAGMPNFRGARYGLITRISVTPATHVEPLYCTRLDDVHIEALPLRYDAARWEREFFANWPPGSPAYLSYSRRITRGPPYDLAQAPRWRVSSGWACTTERRLHEEGAG